MKFLCRAKRPLSVVLAIVLICALLPGAAAKAEEEPSYSAELALGDQTYRLSIDVKNQVFALQAQLGGSQLGLFASEDAFILQDTLLLGGVYGIDLKNLDKNLPGSVFAPDSGSVLALDQALDDFLMAPAQGADTSVGIIGGADGPTAIYVTSKLASELLGPIAIAAYSYMARVPVIQPPIMRALTSKKERLIRMDALRTVSKKEKIIFPIAVTFFVALLVPSATPLIGCLMLGNLFRECGVVDRLSKTAQNELMNIVVILLGVSVGATAKADSFLTWRTIGIIVLGVIAFAGGTAGGVLLAKFMNLFLPEGKKINPLIGSAGVSAVPMAARVSQKEGQRADPGNFLLMHAMGPNVAGVIGSAVAAGVFIALFG